MRVLFISNGIYYRGTERYLYFLIKGLTNFGIECVAIIENELLEQQLIGINVETYKINFEKKERMVSTIFRICKRNIDIVHVNRISSLILLDEIKVKCRIIFTMHCMFENVENEYSNTKYRKEYIVEILNNVESIIAVSVAVKKSLIYVGVKSKKIVVIYNGIDTVEGYIKKESNLFKVVYIGGLSYEKGPDLLIKAAHIIINKKNIKDICFVLFGDGDMKEELFALSQTLNISKYIEFRGFKKNPYETKENIDLIVVPSRSEGLGYVILEAMNLKIPVLASNSGGIIELIEDQKTGFLFQNGNERELAQKILQIKKMGNEKQKVAENAYIIQKKKCGFKAFIKKHIKVIKKETSKNSL